MQLLDTHRISEPDFRKWRLLLSNSNFLKIQDVAPGNGSNLSHTKSRHCHLISQRFAQTIQPKAEVSTRSPLYRLYLAAIPFLVGSSEETEVRSGHISVTLFKFVYRLYNYIINNENICDNGWSHYMIKSELRWSPTSNKTLAIDLQWPPVACYSRKYVSRDVCDITDMSWRIMLPRHFFLPIIQLSSESWSWI